MRKNNKKTISIFMIILFLGLVITGCVDNKPNTLTQAQKIEDFEYMYKIIKENYSFLEVNKRVNGIDWLSEKEDFLEEIKNTKDDDEFFYELSYILDRLNNGHTHMLDQSSYENLISVYSESKWHKAWYEEMSKPEALKRYVYKPKDNNQKADVENMSLSDDNENEKFIIKDNIETKIIDDKVGYLRIKSFYYFNEEVDKGTIKDFIYDIKGLDGLIIDIRGNGGGTSSFWARNIIPLLIEKELRTDFYNFSRGIGFTYKFFKNNRFQIEGFENLKKMKHLPPEVFIDFKYYTKDVATIEPRESINFKGKVFLLVDEGVYSAAEMFAVYAKETGFATLIGETTGGDGITKDPAVCTLPNSGFVFRFSYIMGTTQSGVCNEEMKTIPHYSYDAEITEDIEEDKCIQKAIELMKK
ncbi:S41 family peptidase [Oceanirhabdus sp. W0125-5]|uniref:S41 family peptidase n=1 Tax=Oceanirhabdus sp. W0125-5 TaxID=2999116 RepID=UPI0022F2E866|nr:S41 family peptidase [Oceanirhabdus sp. W0125-5]WBW95821.1 S41 family peptidase [Oceanirhabdus sp. W0125-5]